MDIMTNGTELPIKDALLINTPVFVDDRGAFEVSWESYDPFFEKHSFAPLSLQHSYNPIKGTLRGLHFQCAPYEQSKLVTCVSGSVWDVMVDLRSDSPTFQQWHATEISAKSGISVYIPEGCAHGFLTLQHESTLAYLIEKPYVPEAGGVLSWDDETVGVDWPHREMKMSEKDASAPKWNECKFEI